MHLASNVNGATPNGLLDVLALCNFNQFNTTRNKLNGTLDLFMSNLEANCIEIKSLSPLVMVDEHHPPIIAYVNLSPLKFLVEKRKPKTNFYRANYSQSSRKLIG